MYLNARVHIADVMDQVVVQATVFCYDHTNSVGAEEWRFNAIVPGEGETIAAEWLRDALVGLLETL